MVSISGFAAAISLSADWPRDVESEDEMNVVGLLDWASGYFRAAEILHFSANDRNTNYYCGPVIQSVGLATELTLKAMLRGCGKTQKEIRKFSHNNYGAYCAARECFDEVKFINLHFSNCSHLSVPDEVRERMLEFDDDEIARRWLIYFDHLRLLDTIYDRPFRGRYIVPGKLRLPETEILLRGTKVLLSAMNERANRQ